jgi:hypothetical protein
LAINRVIVNTSNARKRKYTAKKLITSILLFSDLPKNSGNKKTMASTILRIIDIKNVLYTLDISLARIYFMRA